MSNIETENISKNGILGFSNYVQAILQFSQVSISVNMFSMIFNQFNENYAGMQAGLVELINIRRINIYSDEWKNEFIK